MKKSIFISGVICAMVLLSGCTEAELNGDGELSEEYVESAFAELGEENSSKLPVNVENGKVSENMYLETMRFLTEFAEYDESMFGFQDRLNKDSSLYDDDEFISQYKESMDSYEVFIKGFHLSPRTEADFEIDSNLSDALLYTSYIISSLRQYIDSGDKYHLSSLEENANKAHTSYTALTNTIKKHELYTEE